jgi:serine/threonine protein phosphatase PrpC
MPENRRPDLSSYEAQPDEEIIESGELLVEERFESETTTSKKHPDRNEDAVLGDVNRERKLLDENGKEVGSIREDDFFEQLKDATTPPEDKEKIAELAKSFGPNKNVAEIATRFSSELYEATQQETSASDRLKQLEVYGVFDGVSGEPKNEKGEKIGENGAGWVASRIVSAEFARVLSTELDDNSTADQVEAALRKAAESADARVKKLRGEERSLKEMAATGDVVKLVDNGDGSKEVVAAHFGDSRIYKVGTDGKLERISFDDGTAKLFYELKRIDAEEYEAIDKAVSEASGEDDPILETPVKTPLNIPGLGSFNTYGDFYRKRNALFSPIGGDTFRVKSGDRFGSILRFRLEPGEKLLLTTDGVHDNVADKDIEETLRDGGAKELAARANGVIEKGEGRAKPDDVTALLIENPEIVEEIEAEQVISETKQFSVMTEAEIEARYQEGKAERQTKLDAAADMAESGNHDAAEAAYRRVAIELYDLHGELQRAAKSKLEKAENAGDAQEKARLEKESEALEFQAALIENQREEAAQAAEQEKRAQKAQERAAAEQAESLAQPSPLERTPTKSGGFEEEQTRIYKRTGEAEAGQQEKKPGVLGRIGNFFRRKKPPQSPQQPAA